jgi:hypothetical protein
MKEHLFEQECLPQECLPFGIIWYLQDCQEKVELGQSVD